MELKVDLSNPEEVAAKMPELLKLYEAKLREQKTLNEQVELLRRVVDQASGTSRGGIHTDKRARDRPPELARRRRASPAQDRAVEALEQASSALVGSAVGPTSLYKFMTERGMDVPKDAGVLGTNLWDAWKAGRIMRAPNGVYTPLDGSGSTEWDRPLTDYYYAAERGFPVPGSWPPSGGHRS
jgi:hypothetical protein